MPRKFTVRRTPDGLWTVTGPWIAPIGLPEWADAVKVAFKLASWEISDAYLQLQPDDWHLYD